MKAKTTKKSITYLNYSLSKEEQEILTKSSTILEQVLGTIEDYTNVDLNNLSNLSQIYFVKNCKILKFLQGLLSTTSENSSFVRYQNGFLPSSYCIFIKSLGCNAK